MSKQQEISICFPGEESWELWRQKAGVFELAETAEIEDGSVARPFKSATHYAFPIISAYAVPVWASSEDQAVVRGVVEMHLEGLGVKPGNPVGQLLDHRIALRKDGRSLVLATVLSEGYELSLPRQSPEHFDISARFLVLPSNHITVWKELGRMVLAVTRDDQIVHFQALSTALIDAEAVREMKCLMLQLFSEGVIENPSGLVLWVDGVEEAVVELAKEKLGIRVVLDRRPTPVLPEKGSKLLPTVVAIQRLESERLRKIRNVVFVVAALWVAFIGYQFWKFYDASKTADKMEMAMRDLKPKADWIPKFKERWRMIEKAIEIDQFPIEIIHRCVERLPPKGVRFTSFAVENDTITIFGEADKSAAASNYGGIIFKDKQLSDYIWDWQKRPMYNTKRKDGTVDFSIIGKSRYATSPTS